MNSQTIAQASAGHCPWRLTDATCDRTASDWIGIDVGIDVYIEIKDRAA
jgi:hypothetical protein